MPRQLHLFLLDPAPAPPAPEPLPDADERALALDIRRSWIVEAPAGSGKTGLLIRRFLRLLADPSVHSPEQVLAITFTKKAAAEMRDRVLSQLQSAAAGSAPANEFDRATRPLAEAVLNRDKARDSSTRWSLPDNPRRINIRTIDSVCSEIASLLPILSGSGGRRSPAEDAEPLYALAARRTFLKLGGINPTLHEALSTVLLHRDGNLRGCELLLAQMLEVRDQWDNLVPLVGDFTDSWLDANVLPRLEHALDQAICAGLSAFSTAIPTPILESLATVAAEMAHLEGYKGSPSPIAICAGKSSSPQALSEDLDHWLALVGLLVTAKPEWRKKWQANHVGFQLAKSEQGHLESLAQEFQQVPGLLEAIKKLRELPPATYPADQWRVAKALFRILSHALVELQFVFAERGQCDFTELSLAARTALAPVESDSDSPLEAALGIRYQHLLVDEMQDTSSSQFELIQMLIRGWDGHSQTVFLVGDPKQSIYLFRQARVERFLRTLHSGLLGDLPLGVLRLTANFRSQAELVSAFNTDFAAILPAASATLHPEEVPFVPATAARPVSSPKDLPTLVAPHLPGAPSIAASSDGWDAASPRVWHTSVLPHAPKQPGEPSQAAMNTRLQRRADAREIRGIVESWRDQPLPPGRAGPWKIAVLCRSRNHLDEIVAALKRGPAIAFRAVDVDPLKDRPEVQDLFALTRALLHPTDRIAWLALLRAPWCGLTLADLLVLTGEDDPRLAESTISSLIAERGHLLSEDSCQRLERIWPVLEAAFRSRSRLSLAQLVERTWRSLGGDTWLEPVQLTNVARYLQLLDDLDTQVQTEAEGSPTALDLSVLERRLDRLYAAPAVHPGAVDLLTIHRAKGLEWDVVIVPALERPPAPPRYHFLNWIEIDSSSEDSAHVLLAPIAGKGEDADPLCRWINRVRAARESAELMRLFYVACTRAREELHLFAAPTFSAKGNIEIKPTSLLAAAWPAAKPFFAGLPTPLDQSIELHDERQSGHEPFLITRLAAETDSSLVTESVAEPEADIPSTTTFADEWEAQNSDGKGVLAFPPSEQRSRTLRRLSLSFDPSARLRSLASLNYADPGDREHQPVHHAGPAPSQFERPEGSLAARALGNAVHAFLEHLAARTVANESPAHLLAVLPSWTPRIAAVLRSEGLPAAVVERFGARVLLALESALKDPVGLWLLSPQESDATEYALTAWASKSTSSRTNIRIDRVFRAGPEPLTPGVSHLWIVDYKTSTYSPEGLEDFLAKERARYAPQLETYAAVLTQTEAAVAVRVALYYPMLSKLIWWQPD